MPFEKGKPKTDGRLPGVSNKFTGAFHETVQPGPCGNIATTGDMKDECDDAEVSELVGFFQAARHGKKVEAVRLPPWYATKRNVRLCR